MVFKAEHADEFIGIFNQRKHLIASFEGCTGVQLFRDIDNPGIFFTYSTWADKESLEKYRASELFNSTWDIVKKYFNGKPEAWSIESAGS